MWRRKRRNRKEKEEADFSRQWEMDALKVTSTQLLAKETTLKEKEKGVRGKLEGVGQLLIDGNNKLKSSLMTVKSSNNADISATEVIIETATELSQKLNTEISDIQDSQRSVENRKRKLIEKSLGGSCFSKQPRLSASLTKPASRKKATGKNKTIGEGSNFKKFTGADPKIYEYMDRTLSCVWIVDRSRLMPVL